MDTTLCTFVVGVKLVYLVVLSQFAAEAQAQCTDFPGRFPACPSKCDGQVKDNQGKWKLVFKAVQGGNRNISTDFISGGDINGGVPGSLDLSSRIPFRDTILDNWNGIDVSRVKVLFLDDNVRVAWFLFNGVASTLQDWFSKDNLIASSYPSLKTTTTNYFSIEGDDSANRRFFINQNYDRCPNDCGFVGVVGSTTVCAWDRLPGQAKPYFVYSDKDTCTKWQDSVDGAKVADTMAIFIKFSDNDW